MVKMLRCGNWVMMGNLALATVILATLSGFSFLLVGAAAPTVTLSAGVEYQSRAGGGIITFTSDYTPTSISVADNFLYLTVPFTGYSTLGIDAPIGANVSVTSIAQWELDYSTAQPVAARVERIYAPGRTEPTVTGAGSSTYAGYTSSITTNMPDNVAVKWTNTPSYATNEGALLIVSFLPLIIIFAAIGAYRQPEQWGLIVGTALVACILLVLGTWLLGIGA